VDTKEQLSREYTKWWEKYKENREKVSAVMKRWYEIQKGGSVSEWADLFADAEIAFKNEDTIIAKLRGISNKLKEISQ
jgi:hypothetical protein